MRVQGVQSICFQKYSTSHAPAWYAAAQAQAHFTCAAGAGACVSTATCSKNAPAPGGRSCQRLRATVISMAFSSWPPCGVMYISYSIVSASTILVTLRHSSGPLIGSS